MEKENLCLCEHVEYSLQGDINIDDFNLKIEKKKIIAIISEDQSATRILQLIGGLKAPTSGEISFPHKKKAKRNKELPFVQFVPDDIICYDSLCAKDFLKGMSGHRPQVYDEAQRLVGIFGIEAGEKLLDMTFEQNRLVGMIQALMAKPELLLLDRPYDMLLPETYLELLRELASLYAQGSSIVLTAENYADVFIPCSEYLFMQEGRIKKRLGRKEIPQPAKVVTMWGGSLKYMDEPKLELLYKKDGRFRFLYRDTDMQKMAECLSKSGCKNFNVEELSVEEEIFADYTRWMS